MLSIPKFDKKMCSKQFKKLGINMVTIMDKEKGVNRYLPSILDLLQENT